MSFESMGTNFEQFKVEGLNVHFTLDLLGITFVFFSLHGMGSNQSDQC